MDDFVPWLVGVTMMILGAMVFAAASIARSWKEKPTARFATSARDDGWRNPDDVVLGRLADKHGLPRPNASRMTIATYPHAVNAVMLAEMGVLTASEMASLRSGVWARGEAKPTADAAISNPTAAT